MSQTYSGQVIEIGGAELGRSGKEKPRKVVITDKPGEYQGKTFRIWSNEPDFLKLQTGQWTTVYYEPQEVHGQNGKSWTQNMIVGVDGTDSVDGAGIGPSPDSGSPSPAAAGTPAPSTDHSDWGAPPRDMWGDRPVQTITDPTTAAKAAWDRQKASQPLSKDDYYRNKEAKDEERNKRMAIAWAIGQAVALGHKEPDQIESTAHQLLILQDRMVSELPS